VKIKPLLPL